jgi:hypothetical protein
MKNLRLIRSTLCLVLLIANFFITDDNIKRVIFFLIILISLSASIQGFKNRVNYRNKQLAFDSIIAPLAVMVISIVFLFN